MTDAQMAATIDAFLADRPDLRKAVKYIDGQPFIRSDALPAFGLWAATTGRAPASAFPRSVEMKEAVEAHFADRRADS